MLLYHLCTQIHLFLALLSFNVIHFWFIHVILLTGWTPDPGGYRTAVEQTVSIHRIEIKIWASIFSLGLRALGNVVNCRSSEERHLRFPDNAAGPLRWLMISSLLFQQSGTGVEGRLPPVLLGNHVKGWRAWLAIRGAVNGLHMG